MYYLSTNITIVFKVLNILMEILDIIIWLEKLVQVFFEH